MNNTLEDFLLNDIRLIGLVDYLIKPTSWGKEKSFKELTMDINFLILSTNKENKND